MKFLFLSIVFFSAIAFAKAPLRCPLDPVSGERKNLAHYFKISSHDKIVICGEPLKSPDPVRTPKKYFTNYEAHLYRKDRWIKKVFSGSGSTAVRFELRKRKLYEVNHVSLRGELYSLYSNRIQCVGTECKRKDKTCVFDQSKLGFLDADRETLVYGRVLGQLTEVAEADLAEMSVYALAGKKRAYDFFVNTKAPTALSEFANIFFQQMRALLIQMQDEACLKVDKK